jgi:GTP-binding protein
MTQLLHSIRNLAIIAHVDHGKTTLVDAMLRQTGLFREGQEVPDCVLDSNELERERGITILSKNTVVHWKGTKINIIDTPGHADFGGEVERVLSMADGALLLVDAAEGPMPQTRFVLSKAFHHHLVPIVVVNKVDRSDARIDDVADEVLELFLDLDAAEEALDFPVLYGSGRAGWLSLDKNEQGRDLTPLFDAIIEHIPAPTDDPDGPTQFRVSSLDWSDYVGRIVIGRVHRGRLEAGRRYCHVDAHGAQREVTVRGLFSFDGLTRTAVDVVEAGDLCGVHGIEEIGIGDSLTDLDVVDPLDPVAIDEPTMSIVVQVNDSPFAGRDGKYVTSRHLKARLEREARISVALQVEPGPTPDSFVVSGRGVLHLGILLETMRREGYEFACARPRVIYHEDENGNRLEPIEELTVDAPETAVGKVIEILGERRGELVSMTPMGSFQRILFKVPARGLIGVRTRVLNASGGEATMHHVFDGYDVYRGEISRRTAGVMVSMATGRSTFHALDALRDRGTFFVDPQTDIYEGMIVGENCRDEDLVCNLAREKKLNNIRSSTKEAFVKLPPPRAFGIEEALEYVGDGELVEITPKHVRLRKATLKEKDRRRQDR